MPVRPLVAALAALALVPAAAQASEQKALDLKPLLRDTSFLKLNDNTYSEAFTANATGDLTRIVVPVERRWWQDTGPGDGFEPIAVSLHEVGGDGLAAGPALASARIQPEDVPQQPVNSVGYVGGSVAAAFAAGPRIEQGHRYALVLDNTSMWDLIAGVADTDQADTWVRPAGSTGGWSPSVDVAATVVVDADDTPPPPPADLTAPVATIAAPAAGATFTLGSPATASFSCSDEGGSGLASCAGTVDGAPLVSGGALPAGTIGFHDVAVQAADAAGNTGSATARYQVVWPFGGLSVTGDVVQAGSAIPVRFSLGGDRGMDILSGQPAVRTVACAGGETDVVEELPAESQSGLSYDRGTERYQYVWKTSKDWGGTCRRLDLRLVDGSVHSAVFRMR